jgi:WXG100 family type VII secretion target
MQFEVTAAELNNAASNCLNANETIQAEISAMRNYVTGLMGAYQGPAAMALHNLSEQWGSDALALNNVLTTIANNLTNNANNYVASEDSNTKNYVNIASNLPPARF